MIIEHDAAFDAAVNAELVELGAEAFEAESEQVGQTAVAVQEYPSSDVPSSIQFDDERRRLGVDLDAEIETFDGQHFAVRVRNVSLGGVLLTGYVGGRPTVPIEFRIRIRGKIGETLLAGECRLVHLRWTDDGSLALGCRFIRVNHGQLDALLTSI